MTTDNETKKQEMIYQIDRLFGMLRKMSTRLFARFGRDIDEDVRRIVAYQGTSTAAWEVCDAVCGRRPDFYAWQCSSAFSLLRRDAWENSLSLPPGQAEDLRELAEIYDLLSVACRRLAIEYQKGTESE